MRWKGSGVMEEKLRFSVEYEAGEKSMTELCQRYDIWRETGYRTLRRYRASGLGGLLPQSHAAQRHGNQTAEEIEQQGLELRQARMRWGARGHKTTLWGGGAGGNWRRPPTHGAAVRWPGWGWWRSASPPGMRSRMAGMNGCTAP